jgi:phosphoglycerate kinase
VGVAKLLPAYAGFLMQREIDALSELLTRPARPFVAILGGAKVADKLGVIEHLLTKVDTVVLGGGMANAFLAATGRCIGRSRADAVAIEEARRLLDRGRDLGVDIELPVDLVVAAAVSAGTRPRDVFVEGVAPNDAIVDVGPLTTARIAALVDGAQTVFWNGPLGVFEIPAFARGTTALARILAERADRGGTIVVGGGDSGAAVAALGLTERMTHVSTGGGAALEYLEGRELPGVAVLRCPVEAFTG